MRFRLALTAAMVAFLPAVASLPPARADDAPPTLTLSAAALLSHTGNRHITGALLTATGDAIQGAAVHLTITPAFRPPQSLVVQTAQDGSFVFVFHMTRNTRVLARYVDDQGNALAFATVTYRVEVSSRCTTSPHRMAVGRAVRVDCLLQAVPIGTPVHVDYYYRGTWYVVARGRTARNKLTAHLSFGRPATYPLRVVVHESQTYARSVLRTASVTIV